MHIKRYGLQKVVPKPLHKAGSSEEAVSELPDILYLVRSSTSSKNKWSKKQQGILLWKSIDDLMDFASKHLHVEQVARNINGRVVRDRYFRPIKMTSYDEGMEILEFELVLSEKKPFRV